jgi:CTP-dependent riboflavin kinase
MLKSIEFRVTMKSSEFAKKCSEIWGSGYQAKAAQALKIDKMTVSRYVKGRTRHGKIVTIKQEYADKLEELYNEYKNKKA